MLNWMDKHNAAKLVECGASKLEEEVSNEPKQRENDGGVGGSDYGVDIGEIVREREGRGDGVERGAVSCQDVDNRFVDEWNDEIAEFGEDH